MKRILFGALLLALTCCSTPVQTQTDYTAYVDQMIGTGGHGHVFVGANVPFGMIQAGPTSIPEQWDWCSGYHETDSTIVGFSQTHLSGTGIGDLFDVTLMPVVGEVTYARGEEADPQSGLWSYADRTKEIAEPGYYSVPLLRYGITAEMTATSRVALYRITYPASTEAALVIDLENGGCWDDPTETSLIQESETRITGVRHSTGWAKDQKVFFVADFSKPIKDFQNIRDLYGRASFETAEGEQILVKVALSAVSIEGAKANLEAELPQWDFEATRLSAKAAWNAQLSKVKIQTADEAARKVFYTALYHTMIAPSEFNDVNGDYRGADGQVHPNPGHKAFTTYSLWDTYRSAMPLMTILQPELMSDMVNNMLDICDEQGRLPVWHLWANETDCMVGNPGMIAVADAIVKNIPGIDKGRAFEALCKTASDDGRGLDLRKKYGFIPSDLMMESIANDMEYAIADGAAANAARALGKTEDEKVFTERSHSYRHYFDATSGLMRGRFADGSWRTPFEPFNLKHRANDYCEGNAWQYTWLVPQDVDGLVECFGSKEALLRQLDALFEQDEMAADNSDSPDVSGLIGQYAHGNEPGHHTLYLYSMLGQPWKTARRVHEVMRTMYKAENEGLAGNEDVGAMSAWYIISSLGFYEVEPASGRFWFGTPNFDNAELTLPSGTLRIIAENHSEDNIYIKTVLLNGQPLGRDYITYDEIMAGGELRYVMGSKLGSRSEATSYECKRPAPENRLFTSTAVENKIAEVQGLLTNPRLRWMFANCYPNTLDTTVHFREDENGDPDTYVYTGDIPAMWLRDSGAQVWPYMQLCTEDPELQRMIAGVIRRQFKLLGIDPYANAFNDGPTGEGEDVDYPGNHQSPWVFERKWEIDSQCYPIRLAYQYWKTTGDTSIFDQSWLTAIQNIYDTMRKQQRKDGGRGDYSFLRVTDRQLDTKCCVGYGNPVKPCGLIASSFRPSDDATTFEYLIPSNFMAVSSLRKAAEILETVSGLPQLAQDCKALAAEVAQALKKEAVVKHPKYGKIYAFEVDGFGSHQLMDDANVPSLLALAYLGDVDRNDPIYRNTRKFVWSEDNPYFFRGSAGEGIGGPHIGNDMIWPMSIMMKCFTSQDDAEIKWCIETLMKTDAGTGFMHESFHKDNAENFTRSWFAWQNTLFGELILKLISDGKLPLLNSIQ